MSGPILGGAGESGGASGGQSLVEVNDGNGAGSTNTKIRRFTDIFINVGTDILYADSVTLGASFTITVDGLYAISYYDKFGDANVGAAISLNSSQLTTNSSGITLTDRLAFDLDTAGSVSYSKCFITYPFVVDDIIRPHISTNGSLDSGNFPRFTITRVN